ncbi:MAG: hypothetical protein ACTSX7_11040, partial [Alphaproteobacteria bacterium]
DVHNIVLTGIFPQPTGKICAYTSCPVEIVKTPVEWKTLPLYAGISQGSHRWFFVGVSRIAMRENNRCLGTRLSYGNH